MEQFSNKAVTPEGKPDTPAATAGQTDPEVLVPERAGELAAAARDRSLAELASRQSGPVGREQLITLGFSEAQIGRRINRTLWPAGPTVFAVGHPGLSRRGKGMAALLHAGDNSTLSCISAARVWGMVTHSGTGPIHVSVTNRSDIASAPGVVIHRPRALASDEIVTHRGLRVTTPERTLADLLSSSSVTEITRMLEQMVTQLNRSPDDLHAWGHALKGVRGKPKLVRALDSVAGPAVIRSEFESLFRSVCQERGLPSPETNYRLGPWEVDAVWLDARVAVELDGYRWHGGRWQFHRDRRKGLAISKLGYELLRISWPQLKYEPSEVVEAIQYALDRGARR